MLISSNAETVLVFQNKKRKEMRFSWEFHSHEKAAAGRMSGFDPGVEAASQPHL